jgi:uncharacterized protein involved in exopolysaccharide biosynthesis
VAPAGVLSPVGLLNALLRRRGSILLLGILLPAVATLLSRMRPLTYTSTASFAPHSRRASTSNFSGLAAQLGLNVPSGDASQSPAFYVNLLTSREILGAVVDSAYTFQHRNRVVRSTLADFLAPREERPLRKHSEAVRRLTDAIDVRQEPRTGVVSFGVRTVSPDLSRQVAERLISQLNEFNVSNRRTQAVVERQFAARRLDEMRGELRAAEYDLQSFYQRNRDFRNSPELVFQEDRLRREVTLRQQLYMTLAEGYEQAKIDEVRDTPVISVVERPNLPIRPDARGTVTLGVLAFLVGTLIGIVVAVARELFTRSRAAQIDEFVEFDALRRAAVEDLKNPLRPIRRALKRRQSTATRS